MWNTWHKTAPVHGDGISELDFPRYSHNVIYTQDVEFISQQASIVVVLFVCSAGILFWTDCFYKVNLLLVNCQ